MSKVQIKQINGLSQRLDEVSSSSRLVITQNSHNFIVGRVIAFVDGNWVYADATDPNKLGRVVVEEIIDQNSFYAVLSGVIDITGWNLTPSAYYFVDGTGNGTITTDTTGLPFSNPILQAITTTTAHVLPWRPSQVLVEPPTGLTQEYTQIEIPSVTSGNYSSTGITLDFKPINNSTIQVYVNGSAVKETYGDRTGECYFSSDSGATAKAVENIQAGDTLYWNGIIAKYNLDANDYISIVYHKSILD